MTDRPGGGVLPHDGEGVILVVTGVIRVGLVLMLMGISACAKVPVVGGVANRAGQSGVRAVGDEDPVAFLASARKAIATIRKNTEWANPVLVSIEGRGLDHRGRLVPLLGGAWVFKFWANRVEDQTPSELRERVDVIQHVEGQIEVLAGNETLEGTLVRPIDVEKLAAPTAVVPFAIRLGLKVNAKGPTFNYYDVTYNAFYANPSFADANVADVVSYYQREVYDGLHIPADAAMLPNPVASAAPVQIKSTAARLTRFSPVELLAAQRKRAQ